MSRVGSSDVNQRLVTGIDVQHAARSTIIPHIGNSEIHKTGSATNNESAKSDTKLFRVTENACNVVPDGNSSR